MATARAARTVEQIEADGTRNAQNHANFRTALTSAQVYAERTTNARNRSNAGHFPVNFKEFQYNLLQMLSIVMKHW